MGALLVFIGFVDGDGEALFLVIPHSSFLLIKNAKEWQSYQNRCPDQRLAYTKRTCGATARANVWSRVKA